MFKRNVAFITAVMVAGIALTGCMPTGYSQDEETVSEETVPSDDLYYEDDSMSGPGFGITYNGKPGIDLGGGFVVPFDGSAPGIGFGF